LEEQDLAKKLHQLCIDEEALDGGCTSSIEMRS